MVDMPEQQVAPLQLSQPAEKADAPLEFLINFFQKYDSIQQVRKTPRSKVVVCQVAISRAIGQPGYLDLRTSFLNKESAKARTTRL